MASSSSPLLLVGVLTLQLLLLHLSGSIAVAPPQAQLASQSSSRNSSSSNRGGGSRRPPLVVQSTCNSTSFYELCVDALAADPSSSTADVPGLCAIAVSVAAANASATASFLGNASAAAATPEAERAVLRGCAGKYGQAREALAAARASVAEAAYEYAFVHASAAAEYPAVCRALFRRQRPTRAYPAEVASREEGLRRLCTIALDIISLLQEQQPQR
ncbi:hypothetical protein ACP4OV_025941 [Aristida adscensionis]